MATQQPLDLVVYATTELHMQLLTHVLGLRLGLKFSYIQVKYVLGLGFSYIQVKYVLGLGFSYIQVKYVLGLGFSYIQVKYVLVLGFRVRIRV